jgi:hypothetical protein
MQINTKCDLMKFMEAKNIPEQGIQLPDADVDPGRIRVIMISEVPPQNPADYFNSRTENPGYMKTTLPLFQSAGVDVKGIDDILELGFISRQP